MTHKNLQLLVKGMVPVIRELFDPVVERLKAAEGRIAALESRPSIQDKGVWKCGEFYEPGDIVSRSGSAWICRGSHIAVGDDLSHEHFRLLVKRGRDAR